MQKLKTLSTSRLAAFIGGAVLALGLAWPLIGAAQDKTAAPEKTGKADPAAAPAPTPDKPDPHADKDLAAQVAELNDKVAKLMAAVDKTRPGQPAAMPGMPATPGMQPKGMAGKPAMQGKGMPGMMAMESGEMGGMPADPAAGGMAMMDMDAMEMMGMMGMGSMGPAAPKGMAKMQAAAALPGFPGASHLYHIGSTGFFQDHPQHITLTTKQQTDLNHLKEKTLMDKQTAQRMIDGAEQGLWLLTASDAPEIASIQEKVAEIEKLRGEQRIAFIRGVGEAAKVLTDEQRQALLGTVADKAPAADPHAVHKP